jgi:heme oxygenase
VIEGAALGGQIIASALERHLGVTPTSGSAFFSGVGPRTAARWRSYLSWIEAVGAAPAMADVVTARAYETFRTLGLWLDPSTDKS